MSQSQVELVAVRLPDAVATKGTTSSLRRPSSSHASGIPSFDGNADGQSLRSLERAVTITSKSRTAVVITCVTLITAISTLLNGLTTVALPTMVKELDFPKGLLLWPLSIQALTCGCTLLISGSLSDALGARFMYLLGTALQVALILACGLSQTPIMIIAFRGLSGVAVSLCLPSAASIITRSFVGQRRNFAFAAMGAGQGVGFAVGLAMGGVITDSIGWRWGFYLAAIIDAGIFALALWGLPRSIDSSLDGQGAAELTWAQKRVHLWHTIDWVGALIASTSLAMLSYVFATLTGSIGSIKAPVNITLLAVAFALIPVFVYWVGRQERLGKPAIIPNSLWRNSTFTSMCLAVFLTWGSFNALETILTFFFQEVQGVSPLQASLYFLPAPISGLFSNILIGFLVNKVKAHWLVIGGCTISAFGPFVMAFSTPISSYWSGAFLANVFNPVGADSLFTVAMLLITSVFPPTTHGLAGGVFNTLAQIGKSVGLTVVAVVAASVTKTSHYTDKDSPDALMVGYNATFWLCFAMIVVTVGIAGLGLRRAGKVGHKRD